MALNFNIQSAKDAGFSNTQIKDYLRSQKSDVDFEALQSASDEYARNAFESAFAQNPNLLNDYANYLAKKGDSSNQTSADSANSNKIQNADSQSTQSTQLSDDELKARFLQDLSDEYFFDKAKDAKITPKPRDVSQYSDDLSGVFERGVGQTITNALGSIDNATLGIGKAISKDIAKRDDELNKALNEHIDYGTQFSDLPDVLKRKLAEQGGIFDYVLGLDYGLERQYEKEQLKRKIANDEITFADLSKEQKDLVSGHSTYERVQSVVGEVLALTPFAKAGKVAKIAAGAVVGGKEAYNIYDSFKTDSDRQKELKDELLSQEVSYTFKRELEKINNFHASKDIFSITGASVEQKQDYLNAVSQVFGTLGIKEYGVDSKGQIYLSTPQGYAKVEMGFFESLMPLIDDNKFSIAGAIAGASKGAKAKGFKGMVAGGAVGAFAGGSLDYMLAMNSQEREVKASQMLRHATQEGLLSIVGDVAFATGAKLVKKVATTDIKELANNAVQASFIPGLAKNFLDGNKTAALKMRDTHLSASDVQTIETLSKSFGGEVQMPKSEVLKTIEESSLSPFLKKGAKIALEVFIQQNQKDTQAALLQAVRADKSGNLIAFLTQAANSSPLLNKNLQDLLSQTTNNLFQKIQALGFKNTDARDIIRSVMEVNKGVRDENGKLVKIGTYEDVMSNVLGKHFDENFKVQIDSSKFEKFKADLESSGVKLKDEPSLEMFEKNIYNAQGVTFNQLINIRKELNQHLSRSSNATYINRAKMAIQNFIKDDIDTGINNIFKLDSEFGDSAKALFDSTLADYAKLKDLLKQVKDSKILNANKDAQEALETLIQNLTGQGNGKISNLEALTRNIPKENIADFEVSVLMGAMQKAMKSIETFGKDSAGNEIKIFDSSSFLNELKNIQGIQSKAAKDLIQIVEDWNTLFKNDFEIAQRLQRVVTDGLHTSIATTASGLVARNALVVKANMFFRILPHIPFLKSLNERVQGAAVRFHLSKALRESVSVSDFKLNLQAKINTSNEINTESKQILAEIKDGIKPAIDGELSALEQRIAKQNARVAENANTQAQNKPIAEFGENFSEFSGDVIGGVKKLASEKHGQVANIAKREDLGAIDLPYGEYDKASDKGFGLAKIIEKHSNDFESFAGSEPIEKIGNALSEILANGKLVTENGVNTIWHKKDDKYFVAGLSKGFNNKGENNWVLTSYDKKNLNAEQKAEVDSLFQSLSAPKKVNELGTLNSTTNETIPQNLSPLQKAQLKKEQMIKDKLEAQRLADEQFSQRMQEAQKQMQENLESKAANAGLAINDSGIKIGEKIQIRTAGNAPSVSLSDDEIIPTKYAIVKASDLKPQFNSASGLQFRTQADEQTIQNIAQNFEPNKIIGRGGFDDLPIIISDGQVISGNHRAKAMQQFTQGKDLKEQINSFYDEFDDYKAVRSLGKAFENEPMKKAVVSNVVENAHKTLDDVPQALRQEIEQANNIKPLAEFGENFAEFYKNGKGAIAKLLKEKRGQVAGAFEKDDLGEIDLVWGDSNKGLAHIIERRTQEYVQQNLTQEQASQKALEFVQKLPQIIENGDLGIGKTRAFIESSDEKAIIALNYKSDDRKWVLTAYQKQEPAPKSAYSHQDELNTNTSSEIRVSGGENKGKADTLAEPPFTSKSDNTLQNPLSDYTTNLNASRDKYTQAIKERLGIELKDDELLVRIADIDETTQAGQRTIINLAMASNANRAGKVGDVFVSALGKYDKNIQNLPRILGDEADNVEQLKYIVARELDKNAQYPNIEEANKALFASLAKSTNSKNMAEAINMAQEILKNNEAGFAKLSQMLTDNAGNFRNLVNNIADMGYKNLEVRPYLTDAIIHTAKNLDEGTRKVNIQNLVTNLEADIANANANGGVVQNLFGENKQAFNDYISEALGVALARFVRLENPSANLFEFFKSLEKDLYEKAQPDFFNMNKTPDDINIIDFITILLEKGQITESVQKLGASLETLREPYAQFLKSVNKNAQKYGVQLKNAQKADDDILYKLSSKDIQKLEAKEKQNLKDLVDGKIKSVVIRKDLENIDEAILLEKGSKNKGFTHIKFRHLKNEQKEGFVKDDEILNLGIDIRKYLAKHKEPYTDKDGARLYEWQNEQGNKFRVVVSGGSADSLPATNSTTETIITFYSDRNAKTPMDFKNPRVELEKEILEFENAKNRWGLESAYYSLERANRDKNYIAQKLVDEAKQKYYAYLHLAYKNKGKFENPKKFFDLLEWHKDSHPFTKNGAMEYNTPKTFYHGSGEKFSIFEQDNSGFGYFFSTNKNEAKDYKGEAGRLNSVFLNIKNPFRADEIKINSFDDYKKWQEFLMPNARFHKGELEKSYKLFLENKEFFQSIKSRLEKNGYKLSETNGRYINTIKGGKYYRFDLGARSWDMQPHEAKVFGDLIRKYEKESELPVFKKYEWARNEFDLFRFNLDFFDQMSEYKFGKENFKELLQSKGYDGIIFNDFQVSVFDSKQIKEISNRGKDGKYFDGENPNIYYKKVSQAVDELTQTQEFKELSKDKQEAILHLRNITPAPMPKGVNTQNLQQLTLHFSGKADEAKRNEFLKLYEATKNNADLVLDVLEKGELRQQYIKVFEHKENKDLAYIVIAKDETDITAYPMTRPNQVLKAIAEAEGVRNFREISYRAAPIKSLTLTDNSIPKSFDLSSEQSVKELSELFAKGADSTNAQIFEKVAKVAQDFGVKVEFAPKLSHESAMGEFEKGKNIVRVRSDLSANEQSETILHELIHASTIKAIDNIDNLNAKQMQAVTKLREIYENTKSNNPNPPREIQHALSNFKEFVAELSNPALRQELKAQNLLEKIADVILEFFNLAGLSDVSKAKKALMDLLDSESAQAGLDKDARRIYDLKLESLEKAGLEPPTPSGEASKQSQSHKNTSGESNAPFEINNNPSTNNAKISNKQKVKNRILEKKINKLEATKQRLQSAQAIQKLDEIIQKHKSNLAAQGVRFGIKQDLASGEN